MTVGPSPGVLVQDLARLAEDAPPSALTRLWGPGDDWTISDGTARLATLLIEAFGCSSVLEFGAGRSSLVMASALDARGGGRLTSIEHQPEFAERAWARLPEFPSVDALLVRAGLARRFSMHGLLHEYTGIHDALDARAPFDFVFVDGPPGHFGRDATLLAAAPHLSPGCVVLLDDAARAAEQTAVRRWERALDVERLFESTSLGRGVVVLRVTRPGAPRFSPRTFLGTIHDRLLARRYQPSA